MGRGIAFLFVAALIPGPTIASADEPVLPPAATKPVDFARDVRPIFVRACYSCHGPQKQRGSLRLDRKSDAFKGGSLGNDIVPGKSAASLLVRAVSGVERDLVMPPKDKDRLPPEDIAILRAWIEQGAKWPDDGASDNPLDWWSLRPLTRPKLPTLSEKDAAWVRTPIDAFVIAKLREKGLTPSPEADRRTLLRRLSFDLTGLPPTPEEVATFLADTTPDAYERLVERLLASPSYGERWARHWLDVVHYGETHGYDKDKPRLNAWPYRDYVIRAFNDDRPYGRFVQEQLAADVLFPNETHLTPALGFIAAGPWDFIGHAEVPETKIDGKVARHLDRDDMVGNTMQTFNSVTVQCAQCHNHKFDPITQEEYYSLQAVFAAVDRTERRYDLDPIVARRRAQFEERRQLLTTRKSETEARIAVRACAALTEMDRKIAVLEGAKTPTSSAAFGYHSGIEANQDTSKWVQVDLKQTTALSAIVLHPCRDSFNNIGEGFGFPARYRIEISDDAEFKKGVTLVADHTGADVPNPGVKARTSNVDGKTARYVRVTATKLAPRMNDFIFALSELEARDASGRNVALGAMVTALDSIEAPPRWRRDNLVDGYYPGIETAAGELGRLRKERAELLARETTAEERETFTAVARDLAENARALATLPPQETVYIGGVHNGSGAFRGTGPDGGKPRPIYLLNRGNVTKPGKEVSPGALAAMTALRSHFDVPPDHPEGERRAALARWLTDERNPLTWRSIVNRIWYYHFGRGIVETPNDFGRNGQLPTHPELLDWLAVEFRDGGQSLKSLHRLIVTSATYRQGSANNPDCASLDANNRYLWHANRRRLEAEAVRDSVLVLSGKMNRSMYGRSYQDFVIDKPEHSPHYEYDRHNPEDPASHRRAIYRFIVRSQQQPFMTTLDCADPSMQVDRRNESLSALQALAMLNNDFMVAMSRHFAERLEQSGGDTRKQVEQGFREALGRAASAEEAAALTDYAEKHGLANFCRVLFNLNEFVFVD